MRLHLVCAAVNQPTRSDGGDALRVHGLLRALAAHHAVTFVGVRERADLGSLGDEMMAACEGRFELYDPISNPRSAVVRGRRWSRAALTGAPPRAVSHYVPAIARRLEDLASRCDGVVLLDNAISVHWRSLRRAPRLMIDVHQVAGWTLTHADRPRRRQQPLARTRLDVEAALMRSHERQSFGAADAIVVTSDAEAARLAKLYGITTAAVVPSALDVPGEPLRASGSGTIGWVGGLGYGPNRDGLLRFVNEAWPALGEAGYRLVVAGRGADDDVQALSRHRGTEILGYVADLPSFLRTVDVAVVPLWEGAGVKLKTVTFLGAGIPVVSTTVGLEGINAVDGTHVVVRDTPAALADGLRMVLEDGRLAQRLATEGRALATAELSWTAVGDRFVEAVERMVAEPRTRDHERRR